MMTPWPMAPKIAVPTIAAPMRTVGGQTATGSATGARRRDQSGVEEEAGRGLGLGLLAGHEVVGRVGERRGDREKQGRVEIRRARADHEDDADEAGKNREPAPPANPFAEYGAGQPGDHEGAGKADGRGLIHLQGAERQEVEQGRAEQGDGANDLRDRAVHAEGFETAPGAQGDDDEDRLAEKAHPDDFDDRHRMAGKLCQRIKRREAHHRDAEEADAAEARGAFAAGLRRMPHLKDVLSVSRWPGRRRCRR
jgi:hypothetical protein